MLEKLDLYVTSGVRQIVVERNDNTSITFYIFENLGIATPPTLLQVDTIPWRGDIAEALQEYLYVSGLEPEGVSVDKIPIIGDSGLFTFLVSISELYLIVRLKEETRGGEYLELCQITRTKNRASFQDSPNIVFYKKDGIKITTMLDILINEGQLSERTFSDPEDLYNKVNGMIEQIP